MRKYVILTALLFTLSACGIVLAHGYINPQKDDVTVTETVLAGDRTKASGIEITVEVQSTENILLYWQTKTQLQDKTLTSTVFALDDYKSILREGDIPQEVPIQLTNLFPFGGRGTSNGIDFNEELGKTTAAEMLHDYNMPPQMIIDAAAKTPASEKKTWTMPLADYLGTMPITLDYEETALNRDYQADGEYLDYGYFQIPVPENFCYEVTIEKNTQDRVTFYGANPASDDNYVVDSYGCIDGNMLYLAVSGMSTGFDHTDQPFADITPEQRGIHCIPLIEKTKILYVDFDHAYVGFRLDEDERVLQMLLSIDQQSFLLYTEENGQIYFSLIDKETMTRTQKIALIDAGGYFVTAKAGDGYSVVLMENGDFVWLAELAGKYTICRIDTLTALSEMKRFSPNIWDENFSVCCDGKRLAIAAVGLGVGERRASDCILQVFDENGRIYAGLYENSLQGDMLNHDMEESWLEKPVTIRFVD